MSLFHVIEVPGNGEILLRRSGDDVRKIMHCKVLRTQGVMSRHGDNDFGVMIVDVSPGFFTLHFTHWFSDWSEEDNLHEQTSQGRHVYSGRQFEIAYDTLAYESAVKKGSHHTMSNIDPLTGMTPADKPTYEPYCYPIVAVRIDNQWTEPFAFEEKRQAG